MAGEIQRVKLAQNLAQTEKSPVRLFLKNFVPFLCMPDCASQEFVLCVSPNILSRIFVPVGDFVLLKKFTRCCAAMKFVNGLLSEILPAGDIDGFKPALLAPAPCGALSHTNLFQPFGEADNRGTRGYCAG